jgi:hypothetical protein
MINAVLNFDCSTGVGDFISIGVGISNSNSSNLSWCNQFLFNSIGISSCEVNNV